MEADVRVVVGGNVRRLRKARGLTQEDLAEAASLSQQHISEIETGKQNPMLLTLFGLAKALGATLTDLMTGV